MKRKNIMILMISLSLVLLLGSSYALLRSSQVGNNPYVINVGTLQVTFVDSETEFLNLTNMYPMSDKEGSSQDKELSFMVKNTGNVDSYYDVTLEETSTNPEFKSVIRFISNKDEKGYNQPKTLGEDKFIEVGGYLKPKESSSYKVKIWLDYNADNTYMSDETSTKEFKAKVVVNSFQESEYAKDVIKNQLVKYEESSKEDFTGGLVAVNTDGDLYNEEKAEEIREYRYSGPTVNNYVTFNDELWRIIGVFKDEKCEEQVKIVRNTPLDKEKIPSKFTIEDIEYFILNDGSSDTFEHYVYFNKSNQEVNNNDWTTAGLQYYLNREEDDIKTNKGYLNYLTNDAKNMINISTFYLGNANIINNDEENSDNSITSYFNERESKKCDSGITTDSNLNNCNVWYNYQATWQGKIGLIYPSDLGYAANSTYWHDKLNWGTYQFNEVAKNTDWLSKNNNSSGKSFWTITPSPVAITKKIVWNSGGVFDSNVINGPDSILPTLYLKSNVKITGGTGEENNPYTLDY